MKPALVKHEPWYVDFDTSPGVKTDYDLDRLEPAQRAACHAHRFPVEGDYDIAGTAARQSSSGSEPLQVAFWIDGKQVDVHSLSDTGVAAKCRACSGIPHACDGRAITGWRFRSCSIYEGLPVSFHGPNPSKLPAPPPRDSGGRGGAGRGGGRIRNSPPATTKFPLRQTANARLRAEAPLSDSSSATLK